MNEACQYIWKKLKPGYRRITESITMDTRYFGNIRIWYSPDKEHTYIMVLTKHGGIVDAAVSTDHGEVYTPMSKAEVVAKVQQIYSVLTKS